MKQGGCLYILTDEHRSMLYVGVTTHLKNRIQEHKNLNFPIGIIANNRLHKLVYFELFTRVDQALARERQLKVATRKQKEALIEQQNPDWQDLYDRLE